MNSRFLIPAGVMLIVGAAAGIYWQVTKPVQGADGPTPPAAADSPRAAGDLEKTILDNPDPTPEELEREIALLRQLNEEAGEPHRPRTTNLLAPKPSRDYDLETLDGQLVAALEGTNIDARRKALREIAEFLASKGDFEMAKRYLDSIVSTGDQFTDSDLYHFTNEFVAKVSESDPKGAAVWTQSLPERLQYSTQQRLIANWAVSSPADAEAWTQSIQDPALRANAITAMSNTLSQAGNAGFAAEWAKRLAGNEADGSRMSEVVVAHWGPVDFEGAFEWSSNLVNEDDRRQAVVSLAKSAAAEDPAKVADWARQNLRDEVQQLALRETLIVWSAKDPSKAAQWVDQAGSTNEHFEVVALSWLKKDSGAAEAWIDAAGVSQERKDYVHSAGN